MAMIVMNWVTLKAAAKLHFLFNKMATESLMELHILSFLYYIEGATEKVYKFHTPVLQH